MSDKREVILSVRNLKQHFKNGVGRKKLVVKAVDDVSFDIYKGEVFGLVGESGCGKTTAGRTIINIYEPTDGEIWFKGRRTGFGFGKDRKRKALFKKNKKSVIRQNANKIKQLKSKLKEKHKLSMDEVSKIKNEIYKIGLMTKDYKKQNDRELMKKMQMIFQDPIASLNPRMTVREIIAEGLKIGGEKNRKVIKEKVEKALETVGLVSEHATRYPHEFSGGQRQRIGIARALVADPELIIADEPISALDVSIQAQVINLMNDLKENFGMTILFIAHDLSVVKYFSDRIGVMYFGKLVELSTAEDLFRNPLHPYTKSLLSAVPLPDPNYEKNRKRITYNPNMHDYKVNQPKMHEIRPGHFVLANDSELEKYKKELKL